ncbi:MAG: DUF4367 domain-containing protein [Bacillota bacterium]
MSSKWSEDSWDELMRKAVQHRMASAPESRPDAQWQRLRRHLDAKPRRAGWVNLGPWSFSRLGLAAYCLMLAILVAPLAFSEQLTGIAGRLFTPVALTQKAPPAEKAEVAKDTAEERLASTAPDEKGGALLFSTGGGEPADPAPGAPQLEADPMKAALPETPAGSEPVETQDAPPESELRTVDGEPAVRRGLTIDEVKAAAPYPVRFPRLLPERFRLADITYEAHSVETGKVILYYDHPEGKYLRVEQQQNGHAFDEPPILDGVSERVTVNGFPGKIVVRGEEWCVIQWIEGEVVFRMWGQLSPNQMKEIAEAL